VSNDTEASEIPALGEGYSHARKAYGLTSALLMAWELIGIELQASPMENLKLTLKSPQAAPYVLIVLIIYFGFRVTIEWHQNDIRRRSLRASRIDFAAAHTIAAAALLLYGFQTLSKIQIANTFARGLITFLISVATIGLVFIIIYQSDSSTDESFRARVVFIGLMGVLGTIVGFYFGSADKTTTKLQIASVKAADKQLITHVAGGDHPYRYSITSTDSKFKEIKKVSEDGWIVEVLDQAPKAGATLTFEVTDNKEQKASTRIDFPAEVKPETLAQPSTSPTTGQKASPTPEQVKPAER
jgi:hypothetical protein